MKRFVSVLLGALLMGAGCMMSACGGGGGASGGSSDSDNGSDGGSAVVTNPEITDRASIEYAFNEVYKDGELVDANSGFSSADDVKMAKIFQNGEYTGEFTSFSSRHDVKMELYGEENARIVNVAAGMVILFLQRIFPRIIPSPNIVRNILSGILFSPSAQSPGIRIRLTPILGEFTAANG